MAAAAVQSDLRYQAFDNANSAYGFPAVGKNNTFIQGNATDSVGMPLNLERAQRSSAQRCSCQSALAKSCLHAQFHGPHAAFHSIRVAVTRARDLRSPSCYRRRLRDPMCHVRLGLYHLHSLEPSFKAPERFPEGHKLFNSTFVFPYHGEPGVRFEIVDRDKLIGVADVPFRDSSLLRPCFIGEIALKGVGRYEDDTTGYLSVHIEMSVVCVLGPSVQRHTDIEFVRDAPPPYPRVYLGGGDDDEDGCGGDRYGSTLYNHTNDKYDNEVVGGTEGRQCSCDGKMGILSKLPTEAKTTNISALQTACTTPKSSVSGTSTLESRALTPKSTQRSQHYGDRIINGTAKGRRDSASSSECSCHRVRPDFCSNELNCQPCSRKRSQIRCVDCDPLPSGECCAGESHRTDQAVHMFHPSKATAKGSKERLEDEQEAVTRSLGLGKVVNGREMVDAGVQVAVSHRSCLHLYGADMTAKGFPCPRLRLIDGHTSHHSVESYSSTLLGSFKSHGSKLSKNGAMSQFRSIAVTIHRCEDLVYSPRLRNRETSSAGVDMKAATTAGSSKPPSLRNDDDPSLSSLPLRKIYCIVRLGRLEMDSDIVQNKDGSPTMETTFLFPYINNRNIRILLVEESTCVEGDNFGSDCGAVAAVRCNETKRSDCEDAAVIATRRSSGTSALLKKTTVIGLGKHDISHLMNASPNWTSKSRQQRPQSCDFFFQKVELRSLDGLPVGSVVLSAQFLREKVTPTRQPAVLTALSTPHSAREC